MNKMIFVGSLASDSDRFMAIYRIRSRERNEFEYLAEGRKSCRADKSIPSVSGGAVADIDAGGSGDGGTPAAAPGGDDDDGDGGESDPDGRRRYQNRAGRRHPAKETRLLSSSNPPRFLRLPEVMRRTGYGRSSIYAYVHAGTFPAPVKIGARAIAWVESSVLDWMADRIAAHSDAA
ncbi:AlpA family transcriptional regulator [Paraburkholderia sp. BL6665CI2N2]|uniref:helix-turn-helix transcriptional regulator n=1 Tax=Paraburkholderia sp. BL6665CI2N2 TaxID=1938806 RepID=UPI0010E7563B|nr:AlpA family transcriptional regulator [Paraburkholderia sp. BL6665CI2N2]TDY23594.1 AlpA family transcriptional regulator [Paraburkholderia sp. BL6665CI2N2]